MHTAHGTHTKTHTKKGTERHKNVHGGPPPSALPKGRAGEDPSPPCPPFREGEGGEEILGEVT